MPRAQIGRVHRRPGLDFAARRGYSPCRGGRRPRERRTTKTMSNDAIILRRVQALGIPDPLQATAQTVRIVLGAYFTRKVLSEDTFRGYMGMLNPSLAILLEGLKAFSQDQSGLSHKVLNHIELAISVFKTRLDRPDITLLEAREIRHAILDLVQQGTHGSQRATHRDGGAGGVCDDGPGRGGRRDHGRAGGPARRQRGDFRARSTVERPVGRDVKRAPRSKVCHPERRVTESKDLRVGTRVPSGRHIA